MPEKILKLGVPKGSLQNATFELFEKAGFHITGYERSYFPQIDDSEIQLIMFRAQEMSRYVEDGVLDAGFTGQDWILENKSDVTEVCQLLYSKATSNPARWVLAVPNESPVQKPEDLEGGNIATELVGVTREYFKNKKINVKVEFSWGASDVKAQLVNAIVELTETGNSLRANNLRIIDTVLESNTKFIMNKDAHKDPWKLNKVNRLVLMLKGAMAANGKVGVMMNVPKNKLDAVMKILPSGMKPTIAELSDKNWVDINVILDERKVRELVPDLKHAGAEDIVEFPLNKLIH